MPSLTPARATAATTSKDQIEPGTPEEAFQAINRAKMLWSFRRRDVDSWQEVIDVWASQPKAWDRTPTPDHPYGTPRLMIERELEADYGQFKEFVRIVLGESYAAKIDEPVGERGAPVGTVNNPEGLGGKSHKTEIDKPYARTNYQNGDTKQFGNSSAYLRQELLKKHPSALDEIGKGKTYATVTEAARKLGIRPDRQRLCFYEDDPQAAGRYLAQRVDREWFDALIDSYYKSIEG